MLPPPSTKRVKAALPDVPRFQTPLRDEFKLNQAHDIHDGDSAWERSSHASGFTQGGPSLTSQSDHKLVLSELLPKPKHHYELSDEVIMQKEEEIQRQEDEIMQRDQDKERDEDMEDMEKRL